VHDERDSEDPEPSATNLVDFRLRRRKRTSSLDLPDQLSVMDGTSNPVSCITPELAECTGSVAQGESACREWAAHAHETLMSRMLPGSQPNTKSGFVEQLATASRVLMLIPIARPQDACAMEFPAAIRVREIAALRNFCWHEKRRCFTVTSAQDGRRTVRVEAELEVEAEYTRCEGAPQSLRCVAVTTLEWLPRSIKPRALSFALIYDDSHPDLRIQRCRVPSRCN